MAAAALGYGSSLDSLIPELTARCSPDEQTAYVRAIASVLAKMHNEILRPIFTEHPDLEQEIEKNIQERGTAF
jgi:hypothetical protein